MLHLTKHANKMQLLLTTAHILNQLTAKYIGDVTPVAVFKLQVVTGTEAGTSTGTGHQFTGFYNIKIFIY